MPTEGIKGASAPVEAALRRAASATGVDFGFLVRTAERESGFNAGARASSSSAAGLFQFVDQTWLATLKRHGSEHGYARYAALIEEGADGRFRVSDPEARRAVMELRYDAHASSIMAGELATDHAAYLRGRIGREPTGGELYAAHFLGPINAARLVEAMQGSSQAPAASLFPDAAAANRGVFYRAGQPVSVGELYANLSATGGGLGVGAPAEVEADPGQAAFATYAGARRGDRELQEAMLVDMLLTGSGRESALSSMFSSEMLALFTQARNESDQ
jgi:hypothetical protein